jgi:hypothetical protein
MYVHETVRILSSCMLSPCLFMGFLDMHLIDMVATYRYGNCQELPEDKRGKATTYMF